MVERGWQYSDLMNMRLSTLFQFYEATVRRYNELMKEQERMYENMFGGG